MSNVEIIGDETLRRAFRAAASKVTPAMHREVKRVAKTVTRKAQSLVPRNTGTLADSIRYEMVGEAEAVTGPVRRRGGWYGHFIERGTVKMGPRPFMDPAADDAIRMLGRAAGQTVDRLL